MGDLLIMFLALLSCAGIGCIIYFLSIKKINILLILSILIAVISLSIVIYQGDKQYLDKSDYHKKLAKLEAKVEKQLLIMDSLDKKYQTEKQYNEQYVKENEKLINYIVEYNLELKNYYAEDFPYDTYGHSFEFYPIPDIEENKEEIFEEVEEK